MIFKNIFIFKSFLMWMLTIFFLKILRCISRISLNVIIALIFKKSIDTVHILKLAIRLRFFFKVFILDILSILMFCGKIWIVTLVISLDLSLIWMIGLSLNVFWRLKRIDLHLILALKICWRILISRLWNVLLLSVGVGLHLRSFQ